ncbi:hypothetical protein GQ457_06G007120 [Hibiscus cannabinus]
MPKHTIITWLAIMGRLSIKDRLLKWGVATSAGCMLCEDIEESHIHLFSECCFVARLWKEVLWLNGLVRDVTVSDPQAEVGYMFTSIKGKTLRSFVLCVSWNAIVYQIWEDRNRRQLRGEIRTLETLLNVSRRLIGSK